MSNKYKSYEFYDTFIKQCEYKDGEGECQKTRESKKCVNGVCENVNVPNSKLEVLDDYYKQVSQFKCPDNNCDFDTSKFNKFKKHIQSHDIQTGKGRRHSKSKRRRSKSKRRRSKSKNNSKPRPTNKSLYNYVKQLANKKFKSKSGIYRSSWIVSEYKRRGGKYSGKKSSSSGLKRWYKEKWVDLNRPIRNSKGKIIGYKPCGRFKIKGSKGKYPLGRPSKRINKGTPRTYSSISSKSIRRAKREKSRIKHRGNIKFGSGKIRSQYYGKRSKVMVKVPQAVKNVALYSFKLKKMGFGGGIETGWKRAKQLSSRESIPIEDLKYMRAWFARHIYASYPSYKKWKKAGRPKDNQWHRKHGIISWLIWSGDAGFKWVNSKKNINLLNKHYNKQYKPLKLT